MVSSLWDFQSRVLQELLKEMRTEAGLTQAELANLLDHPQSYVSKYESGERRLDLIEIKDISACCGSSLKCFVEKFEIKIGDNA